MAQAKLAPEKKEEQPVAAGVEVANPGSHA
jgi:hypothetical protein